MRTVIKLLVIGVFIASGFALTNPPPDSPAAERAGLFFRERADSFSQSAIALRQAIALLGQDTGTVMQARQALAHCRLRYKSIEFFIEYFFRSAGWVYNSPPKFEIEEPYMEYQQPAGLQVMEGLLYGDSIMASKTALLEQADLLCSSAADLHTLLYGFHMEDAQLLESLRLELVRVITLSLSGYDAPLLKSGIAEGEWALEAMQYNLYPFLQARYAYSDSVTQYLQSALTYLHTHTDFDAFDRLAFLTQHALPLQRCMGKLIDRAGLSLHTVPVLNYNSNDLFRPDAFLVEAFPHTALEENSAMVALGQRLFFEKALSGSQIRSCATCHRPDKYFADQLARSAALDVRNELPRNTPTLLYACYQHSQFWDGRAVSLEQQMRMVLQSPEEMHADTGVVEKRLQSMPVYPTLFTAAFGKGHDSITTNNTAQAIAAFVRTLRYYSSPFDRYIRGDTTALNAAQQKGFNVFMGKAQCGTCHFAPLFNGLTPPFYQFTEFEVLGTPASDEFSPALADNDGGRYQVFPISFYQKAFKTPTVRNVAATAPYMHNGRFTTLEKVVDFYDKGGGRGIGLASDNQTLAGTPLHLTDLEKKALVSFLEALTDEVPPVAAP